MDDFSTPLPKVREKPQFLFLFFKKNQIQIHFTHRKRKKKIHFQKHYRLPQTSEHRTSDRTALKSPAKSGVNFGDAGSIWRSGVRFGDVPRWWVCVGQRVAGHAILLHTGVN